MDILNPKLVWIKDRCYRKLPIRNNMNNPEEDEIISEDLKYQQFQDDLYEDVDIKSEGNSFWTSIDIACELMKFVVGKEGATKRRIEEQTMTKIRIPGPRAKHGLIAIQGKSKSGVGEAYRKLERIADSARWKEQFTHFISFPMNFEVIQSSFLKFKEDALQRFKSVRGIHKSIFQNPTKLHLTVSTLVLLDAKERDKACNVLRECKGDILDVLQSKPLVVLVKGVEYMNDDPAEVDVLYAKVSHLDRKDDSLQIIADKLSTAFVAAKLSKQQHDSVKLHITLMNSLFRKEDASSTTVCQVAQDRDSFDARPLLEHYSEYEFGKVEIKEIHISVRSHHQNDNYYSSTSVLNLSS